MENLLQIELERLRRSTFSRDLPEDLIDRLLVGLTKPELEEALFVPGMVPTELETKRMNVIGGLRGLGFVVTGGRKGGPVYQILDWEKPQPKPGIETWNEDDRSLLDVLPTIFPVVTPKLWYTIRDRRLKTSDYRRFLHEVSPLKIFSYDLAQNEGLYYETQGQACIMIKKNKNQPIFSILNLNMGVPILSSVVTLLQPVSVRPIKIVDIDKDQIAELREKYPKGSPYSAEEAIYRTKDIFEMKPWGSSSRSEIRRRNRDLEIEEVRGAEVAQEWLVDCWKKFNEKRQRQLSIVRDYKSILYDFDEKRTFIGFRGDIPVGFQNYEQIDMTYAVMMTEKAFNRGEMPYGKPWTTDGMIYRIFSRLHEEGVEFVQGGQIMGGTQGLADHKRKLASEIVSCYSFDTGVYRQSED